MTPLVDVGYAKYSGRQLSADCNAFLGVPYAVPPVGNLRFRNAVPIATSSTDAEVFDASQYPLFAMQGRTSGATLLDVISWLLIIPFLKPRP